MKRIVFLPAFMAFFLLSLAQEKKWMIGSFEKEDAANPCLAPKPTTFHDPILGRQVAWEEKDVFNPAAVVRKGKVFLLYRAEDSIGKYAGTSRIGLAQSSDGLHFTTAPSPVIFPNNDRFKSYEWEGGCEDPRIVEDENGNYFIYYTAYDGDRARLFVASSRDLLRWKKHGSIFKNAGDGHFVGYWSKSGSVVTRFRAGKLTAVKISGKYWMYWGESNIYAATSPDLINWTPVIEEDPARRVLDTMRKYKDPFKVIFGPRPEMFDSYLVEPGPPALLTDRGIVFMYNSRNDPTNGDKALPAGTYAAGSILLDKRNPLKVLDRSEKYFFKPDKPYEITGQVNNVTFIEGLVPFHGKWYLYYGTADSKIAVATSPIK